MNDWILDLVRGTGVGGVALLMFLENVFPPLPSEIIMPLAGYLSTRGEIGFVPAVLAGSLGSLAGASLWYAVGRRLPHDRLCAWVEAHGAWLAMTPRDVDRAVGWFDGHGRYSVLLGRLAPVVRTLISVPAGFTRMPLPRFLLLSALGTTLWSVALAYAGRLLGTQFQQVERFVGAASWIVVGAAMAWYAYRVVTIRASRRNP